MNNPENREHKIPKTQYDDKQNKKHNTMCVGQHYAHTNNSDVRKTRALI